MASLAGSILIALGFLIIFIGLYVTVASHDLTAILLGVLVGTVLLWAGSRLRARADRSEPLQTKGQAVDENRASLEAQPASLPRTPGPVVINVQPSPPPKVLMKCSHCGNIFDLTLGRCDRCGAPAT